MNICVKNCQNNFGVTNCPFNQLYRIHCVLNENRSSCCLSCSTYGVLWWNTLPAVKPFSVTGLNKLLIAGATQFGGQGISMFGCSLLQITWQNINRQKNYPQNNKELLYNKGIIQFQAQNEAIKSPAANRSHIVKAAHLQWSGCVGVNGLTDTLLWFGVDTFSALPQNHINLHINQQSNDEGYIEGHDRGVYHKGWIGDHTERLITSSCGDKHRVNENFWQHALS